MPGTIQLSVLDFKGVQPSSSASSQVSIKVSMGKKEYQTCAEEDFSFPLTSLRDNLMIKLHDAEGNEISHTGVATRLVVEKGLWDGTFPLEGGGHVHLKLKFVLSEEERHRIRVMRASALRRKHGEHPTYELRSPENITNVGSNAESSLWLNQEVSEMSLPQSGSEAMPADLISTPADVFEKDRFGTKEIEETFSLQKQKNGIDGRRLHQSPGSQGFDVHLTEVSNGGIVEKIETRTPLDDDPERAICSKEASTLSGSSKLAVGAKNNLISPELDEYKVFHPDKQSPQGRTPSNVRNMISAFESSLALDVRPHIKSPPLKSHSNKTETEFPVKNSSLDEVKTTKFKLAEPISEGSLRYPFREGVLQQSSTYTRQLELSAEGVKHKGSTATLKNKFINKEDGINEENISSGDLMRAFTVKTATVPGRMRDEHIGTKLLMNKQRSGEKLSTEECGKGIYPEYSEEVDNKRALSILISKENWKDKSYPIICPGTWIFPVESRSLCITTGSKHLMDLMRNCHSEAEIYHEEKGPAPEKVGENRVPAGGIKVNEGEKTNKKPRKLTHGNSADVETSRGPVGQVMRVAIMIGFATLVFLTRQRN